MFDMALDVYGTLGKSAGAGRPNGTENNLAFNKAKSFFSGLEINGGDEVNDG